MPAEGQHRRPRVYTIDPDVPFLPALARAILDGHLPQPGGRRPDPREIAGWHIFLPSRRAARALAAAVLEQSGQASGVLPRIRPLGDVDEDELAFASAAGDPSHDLPPPIAPLARRFLLAGLIADWAKDNDQWPLADIIRHTPGEAIRLAASLGRLIDLCENARLPLDALSKVHELAADRPEHRLATLELLAFMAAEYPGLLERMGRMGAAARRGELLRAVARTLRENPPAEPVIAAGSTGSIAATAELLGVIARLGNGCVILPGLARAMGKADWEALEESHPQYGMKQLLEHMGVHRREVAELPGSDHFRRRPHRVRLLREAMRPAETTEHWRDSAIRGAEALRDGAEGLWLIEAPSRHLEARAIALLMREVLEKPQQTCTLITPDRDLARAVRDELARWDIAIDDSAGEPLADTTPGIFLKLLGQAARHDGAPPQLAALLAHPLARFGMARADVATAARLLEVAVLRPVVNWPGIAELPQLVRQRRAEVRRNRHEHRAAKAIDDGQWRLIERLAECIAAALTDMSDLFRRTTPIDFERLLRAHLQTAEAIATDEDGTPLLWRGEAGAGLAAAAHDILAHAAGAPAVSPASYIAFFFPELAARPVRPRAPAAGRLAIHGLLEARLMHADRVILGGLNEGVWPPVADNDPWLNRPDKAHLGLPPPERFIGLAAHDFAQAAAGREVWMTCAARIDQQPAEKSRWLLRLEALLRAAGAADALRPVPPHDPLNWAEALDEPAAPPRPTAPPAPAPPADMRPAHISASRVGTLRNDPYGYYARHVLRLEKLPELPCRLTPLVLGTAMHAGIEAFLRDHPRTLPDEAETRLREHLEAALAERVAEPAPRRFFAARFQRLAQWLIARERQWRDGVERILAETKGEMTFAAGARDCTLSAIADRIDLLNDGQARLMDFKTGNPPARDPTAQGYDPQLDLEAAILIHGGFADAGRRAVAEMMYVKITGGTPPGEIQPLNTAKTSPPPARRAAAALDGLARLLGAYLDPGQPFWPVLRGGHDDYGHLARRAEWQHVQPEQDQTP